MAKPLVIIALLLLSSLAMVCLTANAFVLRPTSVHAIGTAKQGQYLWKPQRAISLSKNIAAVRVSLSRDDCNDRAGECQYAVAYTTDMGATFHVDDTEATRDFCGLAGIKSSVNGPDDESVVSLTCITTTKVAAEAEDASSSSAPALLYKTKVFTFTEGSNKIAVTEGPAPATFNQPPEALAIPPATALYFGDTVATFDGPKANAKAADLTTAANANDDAPANIFCRNVEMTLSNGTLIHGFFKSMDGGATYDYVSAVPFPMGVDSALHVTGATKVMVIAGESNAYKQAVSVFLGSRWEKVENVTYSSPLSTFTSDLGTTVYGGLRGRPGIVGMAAGRKRGTEKLVDFATLHNRALTRQIAAAAEAGISEEEVRKESFLGLPNVGNFSEAFINATEFDCVEEGPNDDAFGCASSSYTSVLPLGNGSTVLAFYDKLLGGYNPSSGDQNGEQTLYVMKLHLNETKEQKEADEKAEQKIKDEKAAEEKRKAAEEKRKAAQREAEKREREKRRKKNRADKKKKKLFKKLDKAAIEDAKAALEKGSGDGSEDIVIIREVNQDLIEQERDTFFDAFGPDAEKIAAEEARAEAEAEAKAAEKKRKKAAKAAGASKDAADKRGAEGTPEDSESSQQQQQQDEKDASSSEEKTAEEEGEKKE